MLLAVSPYQHQTDSLPHSTLFLWREVGPYPWYVEAQGYVIVHVDVRGTGLSKGDYNFLDKTEQQDLFEIIEWCGKQPWSNGRVGGYGQSYYAWSQWWMGIVNPPSLKCIAPYDGAVDIYRDVMYHGGIYCDFLPWWYQMVRVNNLHRPPGKGEGKLLARDIPREYAEHNTYDDFWKERSPWERLGEIKVPTLSIGHWGKMGLHLRGNIIGYEKIDAPKKLVVTGARDVFEAHDLFDKIDYHEKELLPFYDRHLKNGEITVEGAPVKLYVRGAEQFRDESEWPIKRAQTKSLYLNADEVWRADLAQRRQPVLGQTGRRGCDLRRLSRSKMEARQRHVRPGRTGPDCAGHDFHDCSVRTGRRSDRACRAGAFLLFNRDRCRHFREDRRSGARRGRKTAAVGQSEQGLAARLAPPEGRKALDAAAAVLHAHELRSRSSRARS